MTDECKKFIDDLARLRKDKKLTQQELGDLCGLAQSAIARLEAKKIVPQFDTLLKVLDALDARLIIETKKAPK